METTGQCKDAWEGERSPQNDAVWSSSTDTESSPVSALSFSLLSLQCPDTTSPRRRLQLTPEMMLTPRAPQAGNRVVSLDEVTPTGPGEMSTKRTVCRRKGKRLLSPGCSASKMRHQSGKVKKEGKDPAANKENRRVCVRLSSRFPSTAGQQEPGTAAYRGPYQSSPAGGAGYLGEAEPSDPMALLSLRRIRSKRRPLRFQIPDSAVEDWSLIGDFSKRYLLPVEKADQQDLHCVSAHTVAALLTGQYRAAVEDFLIIDCRYPYEYQGGHIKGAVNLHTEAQMHRALLQGPALSQLSPRAWPASSPPGEASALGMQGPCSRGGLRRSSSPETPLQHRETVDGSSSPRKLVVLHCEFSSERGPRLCRYLRELDRTLNAQVYPHLYYPELYLLKDGYKHFHSNFPELCEPRGYVPMHHMDYREQLHGFRRKTRTRLRRRQLFKPH